MIDYLSNLKLKDNPQRTREALKLQRKFGYLPVYGPTIEDMEYGKKLLAWILQDYPGYRWVIEVRDTVVTVINETLAKNWGFRLRERMIDNDGRVIKRFAGELLERYRLKAGEMDQQVVDALPQNGRGEKVRMGE